MLAILPIACGAPFGTSDDQPPEAYDTPSYHLMMSHINDERDFTQDGNVYVAKFERRMPIPDPPLEPVTWSDELASIARRWASRCETALPKPKAGAALIDSVAAIDGYPALVTSVSSSFDNWSTEITPEARKMVEYQKDLKSFFHVGAAVASENEEKVEKSIGEAERRPTDEEVEAALAELAESYVRELWKHVMINLWRIRPRERDPEAPFRRPIVGDCFSDDHASFIGCRAWRLILHRDLEEIGCAMYACKPDPGDPKYQEYGYGERSAFVPVACVFSPAVDVSTGSPF